MARRTETAAPFVPDTHDLARLTQAAAGCQGCALYKDATQTVFGEGPADASIVFVGEKPGDKEDRVGRPFVGPAGALLNRAMAAAGIPRDEAYVTNAVKHFKWELRGGRRIHKKPREGEIEACRPWLIAELASLQPRVVVAMGTTAARSLFGKPVRLLDLRGTFSRTDLSDSVFVTIHPSAILRLPTSEQRHLEFDLFARDLRRVADKALRT